MTPQPLQLTLGISLGSDLILDNFVAGSNAALVRQVQSLDSSPQFIYAWGERAAGKTHLLHAACHACASGEQRVALLPLSNTRDWQPAMLEGWDAFDLVALDDVHAVAGQAEWERQLFTLYNSLRDAGKSLLVAADRPPAALAEMLPDLRSRLGAMLVYQLHPLDDEGRLDALSRKAQARGMELPEEVGRYLLARVSRDMRDLNALLDALDAASLAQQRRLTIPFVRKQLEAFSAG